jgi:predicted enzyme related to lactoylglutathione lyase
MRNPHGEFIWYELLTSDPEAAAAFYGAVLGWTCRSAGEASTVATYRIFAAEDADAGGMMPIPAGAAEAGMRPSWIGYIGVDDVDAAARAGGDARGAMAADAEGASFYLMRGAMDAPSGAFDPDKPGHCQWNQLAAEDAPRALDFYCRLFGWEKGDAVPMGPAGDYQFITVQGRPHGAVMTRAAEATRSRWDYFFGVPDIDEAVATVWERGGTITHGPSEVPGGSRVAFAADPQGAVFGLVGPAQ